MRVSNRYGAHLNRTGFNLKRVLQRHLVGFKRHSGGLKIRLAHIDADLTIVVEFSAHAAGRRLDGDLLAVGETTIDNKFEKTASAVTALPNFAAIGVVDSKAKVAVGIRCWLGNQYLIATNSAVSVGN